MKHVTNRSVRAVDLNLECARVEITTRKWQRRDSLDQPRHISPTKEGAIVLEWDETVQNVDKGCVVNCHPTLS